VQNTDILELNSRLISTEEILGPEASTLNTVIQSYITALEERITTKTEEREEEISHKLSLQVAENKRMTQHFSAIKRENQAMGKRVVALEERVAALEIELGGDIEEDE
jgi:hypothetical protein